MEKVEKKFFVYIAKDGKEFLDENECASYEKLMDNICYFRINTTPDLTETGLMQRSIAVLVYSDHHSHYKIALNYAIKELGLRILGEGVQGYGFQQHFDISQSTKQEFESYVKGSIVLEKQGEKPCGHKIIVQKTNLYPNGRKEIVSRVVYVYQYDYDRFGVGDTIK